MPIDWPDNALTLPAARLLLALARWRARRSARRRRAALASFRRYLESLA